MKKKHYICHKIISGAQTGVDRAALDAALIRNITIGGWCPKGRLAEDGVIPFHYPLTETNSKSYPTRTEKNIQDSDGTLIIKYGGRLSGGTALTSRLARKYMKPLFIADLKKNRELERDILGWISLNKIKVLNVAGPRESLNPGIYRKAYLFMRKLFSLGVRAEL